MLREHAPLIALAAVTSVLFYLVFRDLRSLRAELGAAAMMASAAQADEVQVVRPALSAPPLPTPGVGPAEVAEAGASALPVQTTTKPSTKRA